MTEMDHYIEKFRKLRSDHAASWPETSRKRSPYKPLLLLAVIDLFAQGSITTNLIELSSDLSELFDLYCLKVMPPDSRWNIAMPFFHLSAEGFWHLMPLPGKENILSSGKRLQSISLLTQTVRGVHLEEKLFALLCVQESRDVLRAVLIETHFAPEAHQELIQQGVINSEAFQYSQFLLAKARQQAKENQTVQTDYQQPSRDQGFRRAVVTAYNHRCALCGIRMLTPDGHTVVVGAHIISWSVNHNDDPRNGMALCHLCHWTFDEGLIGVSPEYVVLTSPQLVTSRNVPGHLATLNGRGLLGPDEQLLWPDPASLKWHLSEVFLKH